MIRHVSTALTAIALTVTLAACGQQSQEAADKAKASASKAADSAATATKDAATAASAAAKDATDATKDAASKAADATKDAANQAADASKDAAAKASDAAKKANEAAQGSPEEVSAPADLQQRPSRDGRFHLRSARRNQYSCCAAPLGVAASRNTRARDARRPWQPHWHRPCTFDHRLRRVDAFLSKGWSTSLLSVSRRNRLPLPSDLRRFVVAARATSHATLRCQHVHPTAALARHRVVPQTVAA